jgi:exonuclease VII large subunit
MNEYNSLSDTDKYYVSLYGWDAYRKKRELEENTLRLSQQQSTPQPQEQEENLEEENFEESNTIETDVETAQLKLENERKKARILNGLMGRINSEQNQDSEYANELEKVKALKKELETLKSFGQYWTAILSNPNMEKILKTYFAIVYGMTHKMASKGIITIKIKDGKISFQYDFFDSNGRPVNTEINYPDWIREGDKD